MNTKIYKAVHDLAEQLMRAAHKENLELFNSLYSELETICLSNEDTAKDHPVQWETLADFTEEIDEALVIYQKALEKSKAIDSNDHLSSIGFAMASLQAEIGEVDTAIQQLNQAKDSAKNIVDDELKAEIDSLLEQLLRP